MAKPRKQQQSDLGPVTNGGAAIIAFSEPYTAKVEIEGTSAILWHRWNVEAVKEKAAAAKNSRAKKEDNVESYVYRNEGGDICIPGEYLLGSIVNAAKFLQDPRSPRKSAMDLFKAGVVVTTELSPILVDLGSGRMTPTKEWQYIDQHRVSIQRNGVNRSRPAFYRGWRAKFEIEVILPEYITSDLMSIVLMNAGRLIGIGDHRPTYGRFRIVELR